MRSNAEPAALFPRDRASADHAGLYSWWSDDDGLRVLSLPFALPLSPLIYAGQTGGTTTRSKVQRVATLRSRIGANHLNGNVSSSTFRETLTAVLREPLGLRLEASRRLDRSSNGRLSDWMRQHLSIVTFPVEDRGALAELEHEVLERLDPPLNLMGMPPSEVRARLRQLRSALR
jgi:hypothetical protein